jgi:hypothetical protein
MITLSLNTDFEGTANRNVGFSDRTSAFTRSHPAHQPKLISLGAKQDFSRYDKLPCNFENKAFLLQRCISCHFSVSSVVP